MTRLSGDRIDRRGKEMCVGDLRERMQKTRACLGSRARLDWLGEAAEHPCVVCAGSRNRAVLVNYVARVIALQGGVQISSHPSPTEVSSRRRRKKREESRRKVEDGSAGWASELAS
jgi:hypothetical protein